MNIQEILTFKTEPVVHTYTEENTILYALSLNMGCDPAYDKELPFIYESGLRMVPSMAARFTSGTPEIIAKCGIKTDLALHGEQRLQLFRPLPPAGIMSSTSRCLSLIDKGEGKGALLNIESTVTEASSDEQYATVITTLFCRGDGGRGGSTNPSLPLHEIPNRNPDRELALKTNTNQAALYRLNGDRNPHHIDPEFAARVGLGKPILQGLCTYGFACRALLISYCDFDPTRIKRFDARFSSVVYPGETIVTRMWKDHATIWFECCVPERNMTVLRNGYCELNV